MTISPTVRSIHLDFATKLNQGHFGPRKFWHTYLPRLKYHNPAVPMTVNRTTDQAGPATLTVTFGAPSTTPASSTASASDRGQSEQTTTKVIDMKHKHESAILSELTQIVEGKQVEATEEERAQLLELEDQRARSARDAELQKEVLRKKRKEAAILEQARRSVEVQRG